MYCRQLCFSTSRKRAVLIKRNYIFRSIACIVLHRNYKPINLDETLWNVKNYTFCFQSCSLRFIVEVGKFNVTARLGNSTIAATVTRTGITSNQKATLLISAL